MQMSTIKEHQNTCHGPLADVVQPTAYLLCNLLRTIVLLANQQHQEQIGSG